jgi:anti-sigma B factor antagonist
MSSTTESPTARRLSMGDPKEAETWLDQPFPTSQHGKLPDFNCVPCAERSGVTRIVLTGELDIATSPRLRAALSSPADGSVLVILDLSELTFIDATGLSAILSAHDQLRETDRRLVLTPGPRAVQKLFEITGTESELDFLRTPDANHLSSTIT